LHLWLLRHGVDEIVPHYVQTIDFTLAIGVEHDLDRADHVFQPGLVSQVDGIGLDIGQTAEKRQSLAPEYHQIDCDVLLVKLLHLIDNLAKQVDIETAAQATISGNDDDANSLGLTLDHERVLKI